MGNKSRQSRKQRRNQQRLEQERHFDKFISSEVERGDVLKFRAKNEKQQRFWDTIDYNIVTLAHGCAGTGKTLLALWYGMLGVSRNQFEKVVYVRSDVGSEYQRGRGALPGDLNEKMAPLVGPLMDNLPVIFKSKGAAEYALKSEKVEPLLLEDIRGRSLQNCCIVVDECQNFTPDQVKTVLTRLGENSKIILVGDTKQADLNVFKTHNGLADAIYRLRNLEDVGIVRFEIEDVVRNSVIQHILRKYE